MTYTLECEVLHSPWI